MTWIIFKTFLKKAWLWTKEHWQIPFLLVWTILVYILTRRNTEAMSEVISAKRESYKKQIEVLKRTHNEEILKLRGLEEKYQKALEDLEARAKSEKRALSEKEKESVKEVVIKSKGDPNEIKKRIEEEFGFVFVE